jgi:hypothetical protein
MKKDGRSLSAERRGTYARNHGTPWEANPFGDDKPRLRDRWKLGWSKGSNTAYWHAVHQREHEEKLAAKRAAKLPPGDWE